MTAADGADVPFVWSLSFLRRTIPGSRDKMKKKKRLFEVKLDVGHSNSNLLLKGFFETRLHLSLLDP